MWNQHEKRWYSRTTGNRCRNCQLQNTRTLGAALPLKTVSLEGAASPANVSLILVFETADILFEPDNSSSSVTGDFEGERQIGHYNSHPQKTTTTKALLSQNTSGDARGKLCWRQ